MTTRRSKLSTQLAAQEPKAKAIYVSTYIPRECGIATFTKDLTTAVNILNPTFLADIVAIDDHGNDTPDKDRRNYPWEVKYKIHEKDLKCWLDAADYINQSGAEIVSIQHEFGIYGGRDGEYVIPFMERIKLPIVTTFHTIVPNPESHYSEIMKRIVDLSSAVVVMVDTAATWLVKTYNIDPEKVVVIPHGVPDVTYGPTDIPKKKLKLKGNTIMGFGLMNRGKGYEYVIKAMPKIIEKHPNTKFLVLGETHPVVFRNEGHSYREELQDLVKKLKLKKNVIFVNRYLSLDEIIDYLKATDIYITPFSNLDQITSGTLSYAIGAGKACVSTPYLYAQEVISSDRGILIEPQNPDSISKAIIKLLDHPHKRLEYAKNAYLFGRKMIWPSVALKYLDLFELVKENKNARNKTVTKATS